MSTTALKLLALLTMLLDHIAEFIPNCPLWLHWIGRISAPLFMFCMAWGFHYTHDRKKYILRMYGFGVGMGVLNIMSNNLISEPYEYITNNIFVTLLCVALIAELIDIRRKDKKKGNKYIIWFVIYQILSTLLCALVTRFVPLSGISLFMGAITANLLLNEGSIIFVSFGVIMYLTCHNKRKYAISYCIFCIAYFTLTLIGGKFTYHYIFELDYQWMMIASLPFMLIYNGKKGRGLKYLFYIFYPVHIMILYWIGNLFF